MAIDYKLNIELHPNQVMIHEHPARFKVIKAGKRFGKSKWALFELVQMAGRKKGTYWYIAPTYGQAESIMWQELKDVVPPQLIQGEPLNTALEMRLINGSRIKLKGADNQIALRGSSLDGVIFDEAAYMDGYIWPAIIRGQLAVSKGPAYFISSPSDRGKNWYTGFCDDAKRKQDLGDPDWAYWYFTIHDNPVLEKQEVQDIEAANTADTWNLEYLAIESAHSGQIFNEFDYSRHVGELEIKDGWVLIRALDWGITHPTVCLWIYVHPERKQVFVSDEYFKSGAVIQESCSIITQMTNNRPVSWSVIDPSTAKRNSQTRRTDKDEFGRYGIHCVSGDNRDRGYDITKMFFKRDLIKIHPKCKNLILQLKQLQYGDKESDDTTDALRYACVRISDLMFGGNIMDAEAEVSPDARAPHTFNLNDIAKKPKAGDMSWIYQEIGDADDELAQANANWWEG